MECTSLMKLLKACTWGKCSSRSVYRVSDCPYSLIRSYTVRFYVDNAINVLKNTIIPGMKTLMPADLKLYGPHIKTFLAMNAILFKCSML